MDDMILDIPEQKIPHDGTTPPHACTIPSKQPQQQGSNTPKIHSDIIDPDSKLKTAFESSAGTKVVEVLDDDRATHIDVLERLLWRRVLEARLKLMQDYLILKEGQHTKDQSASLDLDADIDKHCKYSISARPLSCRKC